MTRDFVTKIKLGTNDKRNFRPGGGQILLPATILKAVHGSDRYSDKSKNFEFGVAVRVLYVSAHIKPVGDNIFKFSF
jgi:hypothetical protein